MPAFAQRLSSVQVSPDRAGCLGSTSKAGLRIATDTGNLVEAPGPMRDFCRAPA